ncbi:MAG: serine hydrolase domain-containing protein [Clostridia bacterium]|nr:serine hydrolase domain-containing protein [Clostridia bacterium]
MYLENTNNLLLRKMSNRDFDSYGVFVSLGSENKFLHSKNINFDTYFDIASMGKVLVTSSLILMSADRSMLSLDDTLGIFFADIPKDKKNITIKQLLTHTSGIVRYDIPQDAAKLGSDAVANFIINTPLAFEPGTKHTYSCNGMILLGYILEKIHGKPLEKIFNEKIKQPLGYTRSKFNIDIDEQNAAKCYRTENLDGLEHPWDDGNIRVLKTSAGSGGQFFTLGDIKKFADAVMEKSNILYSKQMFDLAEKNYTNGLGEGWGLGWLFVDENYKQTGKLFPIGSFGHCGHTGTSIFFNREKNLYVIILTNATRFLNMSNNFKGYDYNIIEKMREDIHNEIYKDLKEQGLI